MTADNAALIGHWRKVSNDASTARYPDQLEYRADGTYRGRASIPGKFVVWDAGSFRVQAGALRMSTATDQVVSYRLSTSADGLCIIDEQGIEVRYVRQTQ